MEKTTGPSFRCKLEVDEAVKNKNNLYRSLATHIYGSEAYHDTVRGCTLKFIQANRKRFCKVVKSEHDMSEIELDIAVFGGCNEEVELAAVANCYKVTIKRSYVGQTPQVVRPTPVVEKETTIRLHYDGERYTAVRDYRVGETPFPVIALPEAGPTAAKLTRIKKAGLLVPDIGIVIQDSASFYRAVSVCLFGNEEMHKELQLSSAVELMSNRDNYQTHLDPTKPQYSSYEAFKGQILNPTERLSHCEFGVACNAQGVRIVIVDLDTMSIKRYIPVTHSNPCPILTILREDDSFFPVLPIRYLDLNKEDQENQEKIEQRKQSSCEPEEQDEELFPSAANEPRRGTTKNDEEEDFPDVSDDDDWEEMMRAGLLNEMP